MLARALKMAFWVTYDHIGKLIVANLVWSVVVLVPGVLAWAAFRVNDPLLRLVVGVPMTVLTFSVTLPVATVGLAEMVKELIDKRDGSVRTMFTGMRRHFRRAATTGFVFFLAMASLGTSTWFYASRLRETAPWLGYCVSALAFWGLVFLCLMGVVIPPAIVQKKATVPETVKLSALLVMDNPFFVVGVALQLVFLTAISAFTPLLFVYGALAVTLISSAYEMLARKYAGIEQSKAAQESASAGHPAKKLVLNDDEDDYLNRGFRDFLFPWKG